jgi:hypothetical protein
MKGARAASLGVTQNNLGNALRSLGDRESGTAGLEVAVAAYRAALQERTRERVPPLWAQTYALVALTEEALADLTGDPAHGLAAAFIGKPVDETLPTTNSARQSLAHRK